MTTLLKFRVYNKDINNELTLTEKEYGVELDRILSYLVETKQIGTKVFKMIKCNPEYLSYFKTTLMHADWKYDSSKPAKLGTWRINCLKWAIGDLFKEQNKKSNLKLTNFSDIGDFRSFIEQNTPSHKIELMDDLDLCGIILKKVHNILDATELSIFKNYFENNYTISRIAHEHEISFSKTKNIINKSVAKIRNHFGFAS